MFGEPFGSLERGKYDPWVAAINGSIKFLGVINGVKHMGLESVFMWIVKIVNKSRAEHDDRMMKKLERWVAMNPERPDLVEGLISKRKEWVSHSARETVQNPDCFLFFLTVTGLEHASFSGK